jgi:ATP-dependent DNA helicase RecG
MQNFKSNKSEILVSTPVVEVGIDIPNASIIMVEAADRFGLSQLHQLRGRVGRSGQQSYCLLFSESKNTQTLDRLKSLQTIFSGAELAELDLKLRGPGDVYGIAQHGIPKLKAASFSDTKLIQQSGQLAKKILPDLPEYPALEKKVNSINLKTVAPD